MKVMRDYLRSGLWVIEETPIKAKDFGWSDSLMISCICVAWDPKWTPFDMASNTPLEPAHQPSVD